MKIISYNVNGIRAAIKKGMLDWLQSANPDVICIQETKAQQDQVDAEIIKSAGYPYQYWFSAQKKGYSGVAIFCKQEPNHIEYGTGIETMDFEGRNIRVDYDNVSVMSMYLPSGTNDLRLDFKFNYMDEIQEYLNNLKKEIPNLVICGDAGDALGDSIYEANIFIRGQVKSLGADCEKKKITVKDKNILKSLRHRLEVIRCFFLAFFGFF